MQNNQLRTDQASTNIQGNSVNGFNVASKVFIEQSSPALVACQSSVKHDISSCGSKEVCRSVVLPQSQAETSEFLLTSTPSASRAGGAAPSCATPASASQDRKTVYSQNVTPVDRRSNEIRSSMKSSSVASSCSPASLSNGKHGSVGDHGSNLSPGNRSYGNRSTGLSTSDSIFTYSLTDESHDELDDVCSKGDLEDDAKKTLDSSNDTKITDLQEKSNIPVPCDNNNFVDKIAQIKNVIQKEYVHTIVYTFDELTSFAKISSTVQREHCRPHNDEHLHPKSKKTPKALSAADQKDLGHKKFSSRSVKNFLRSMSPASRHRKPSKSSDSLSSKSSNTVAGSLDSASVSEDLEETGASLKKSPAIGKKSPHDRKSKRTICDPASSSLNADETKLSGDIQLNDK